jgi:recombinational DNA repair protein RecT
MEMDCDFPQKRLAAKKVIQGSLRKKDKVVVKISDEVSEDNKDLVIALAIWLV